MLIRDKDAAEIISELIKTNHWEEVPLEKKYTDDYLQPSPRIIKRSDDSFSIKLWTESATHFVIDAGPNGPGYIEVPDCEALNTVLVEEHMHPDPDTGIFRPFLLSKPDTRFLPHHPCQSPTCRPTKIYVPTIAHYITALVAQIQWLDQNGYSSLIGYGPVTDVDLLVRYLFLEISSQRKKLLPQLDKETRTRFEQILNSYKRTRKLKFSDISN